MEIKSKGDVNDYQKLKRISQGLKLKEYYVISRGFIDKKGFIIASDVWSVKRTLLVKNINTAQYSLF